MRHAIHKLVLLLVCCASAQQLMAQTGRAFPLVSSPGGAFEVAVSIAGVEANFLLDTGAAMMTINGDLYQRLRKHGDLQPVREVAVRMADGRHRRLDVYRVSAVSLGEYCELGAVEVVVVPGRGRNLLGLNVLQRFAPLTLSVAPPALRVSGCDEASLPVAAARSGFPAPHVAAYLP